jgi:sugar (pentulose or hexulose) kinase
MNKDLLLASDVGTGPANPPTVAFPAFKLTWIKQHEPRAYEAARTFYAEGLHAEGVSGRHDR